MVCIVCDYYHCWYTIYSCIFIFSVFASICQDWHMYAQCTNAGGNCLTVDVESY
jgi:hypothetical protein